MRAHEERKQAERCAERREEQEQGEMRWWARQGVVCGDGREEIKGSDKGEEREKECVCVCVCVCVSV